MKGVFRNVPHWESIVDNGEIKIASIFQFKGGCEELFPFLLECKEHECSVEFENEGIVVDKNGESNIGDVGLSIYATLANDPKICVDYIQFLGKCMLKQIDSDTPTFIHSSAM